MTAPTVRGAMTVLDIGLNATNQSPGSPFDSTEAGPLSVDGPVPPCEDTSAEHGHVHGDKHAQRRCPRSGGVMQPTDENRTECREDVSD